MKQEITKEFVEKITDSIARFRKISFRLSNTYYGDNDEYGCYNDWTEGVSPIVEKYVDKIIDDILKELPEIEKGTKRTEQSLTPDQIAYESGYSFCRTKIRDYKNS